MEIKFSHFKENFQFRMKQMNCNDVDGNLKINLFQDNFCKKLPEIVSQLDFKDEFIVARILDKT